MTEATSTGATVTRLPDPTPKPVKAVREPRDWKLPAGLVGNMALAVPLILVNAFAVLGQQQWAIKYATAGSVILAWGFAASLESVGVYLSYEAHRSLLAGDAALRLRLASYTVAGIVGALNYEVHAPDWQPNPAAVAFGAMSAISPWLWAVRSRSLHRAELRDAGLIDGRTVRFSMARWLRFPVRTFKVWSLALWQGVTDPEKAIALQPARAAGTTSLASPDPTSNFEGPNLEVPKPRTPAKARSVNRRKPLARSVPVTPSEVEAAQAAATTLAEASKALNRDNLRTAMRDAGIPVGALKASALLREVRS